MKRIISKFSELSSKALYYSYYMYLSERERIKSPRFTNVVYEKPFTGGNVMVLALYEKTNLRNDTIELLKEAKRQNIYVVAVNTLKIKPGNYAHDLIDAYIERDNFGRDFGSYQVGMKYCIKNKIFDDCRRLLIINDSVFFSVKGLAKFIADLYSTEIEVLGATENKEITHHLGSFCISVAGEIARNERFKAYWENYKLTQVRPAVIKRGEFALSNLLKRLVSNESQFKALYDVSVFEKALLEDDSFFRNYYQYRREGGDIHYQKKYLFQYFEEDPILRSFYEKFLEEKLIESQAGENEKETASKKNDHRVNFVDLINFLSTFDYSELPHGEMLKERLMGIYLEDFTRGSQIHNNCIALHHMGLPIIKLDLVYRSMCDMQSILKLKEQLADEQKDEFMSILTSRLAGNKFLVGMNRKAFMYGIM